MQQEINILISVFAKMDSGYTFKPHMHPCHQLNHIVRGSYDYKVGDFEFTAGIGDTVLIPGNYVHSFTQTSSKEGYYYEIKFSSFSKGVLEMCLDAGMLIKDDKFSGVMMREIFEESNNAALRSEDIMVTYLYTLLFKLTEKKRREKKAASNYIEAPDYSAPIRDTIEFLENNYKNHLSLDEIVAKTSLQKSQLSSLFKKETTVTIFECLLIIRVQKALELLLSTLMPLSEICKETGFVNITHFNRVFTKYVMIPPGQYRKYLQSQNINLFNANDKS